MTSVVRPALADSMARRTAALGFGVQRRGGPVVEQQQRRVLRIARDRQALPLAARKPHAALPRKVR